MIYMYTDVDVSELRTYCTTFTCHVESVEGQSSAFSQLLPMSCVTKPFIRPCAECTRAIILVAKLELKLMASGWPGRREGVKDLKVREQGLKGRTGQAEKSASTKSRSRHREFREQSALHIHGSGFSMSVACCRRWGDR